MAESATRSAPRNADFWRVEFAFLLVMAFATLPSPLYGLYRERDDLSAFTITVVYAIFAGTTIATLWRVPSITGRVGRKGVMLASVVTMVTACIVLAIWKDLLALFAGRLLTGVAVGLAAGIAVAYLIELRLGANPSASTVRARTISTSINVGALGIGPLIAGCLAQWTDWPLTLPYLLFAALGVVALAGLALAPETGEPVRKAASAGPEADLIRRPPLPIPAAFATMAAFSAMGLFAGLSGLLLASIFDRPSHALAGLILFVVFSSGVLAQLAALRLSASRVLQVGVASMLAGLVLLVLSVQLQSPSLFVFVSSGALIGAGAGLVFKGTTGIVLEAAAPEDRIAMTSALLIALFAGLSVPVIGAGIALDQGASPPNTVLGFAILVGLGVTASGLALFARQKRLARGSRRDG